jgi:dynein heavy chain
MRILDCYYADYIETEIKKVTAEDIEDLEHSIEPLFVFALTWSIGCTTNLEGREKFSTKFRTLINPKIAMPDKGFIYDYVWDKTKKEWIIWTETQSDYSVDNKMSYGDIVVPTFDSIRMQYIKKLLLMQKKHVLAPGPTGTGKSVNTSIMLQQQLPEDYQYIPITFSAQTSANQT